MSRYTAAVHEMGIALEVFKTCRATVEEHGGGHLRLVRLAVGELSAVEPELLVYAWEAVVAGTSDEGAELHVEWRPAVQFCSACDQPKDRSEGSWLRLCPDCGLPLRVTGGDELEVLDLSFESDDAGEPGSVGSTGDAGQSVAG